MELIKNPIKICCFFIFLSTLNIVLRFCNSRVKRCRVRVDHAARDRIKTYHIRLTSDVNKYVCFVSNFENKFEVQYFCAK